MGLCPCGCEYQVTGRKGKKYATPQCRYRIRNKKRAEIQKEAIAMAIKFLIGLGYEVKKVSRGEYR